MQLIGNDGLECSLFRSSTAQPIIQAIEPIMTIRLQLPHRWRSRYLAATTLASTFIGGAATAQESMTSLPPVVPAAAYAPIKATSSEQSLEARISELEAELAAQRTRFDGVEAQNASYAPSTAAPAPPGDGGKEPPKPYKIGSDNKMSVQWNNGPEMQSANKDFRAKLRGRTQFDWTGFTAGSQPYYVGTTGNQGKNAVDFRRLRMGAEGTFYEQFDWAVELDFINSVRVDPNSGPLVKNNSSNAVAGVVAPTDVWLNMKDVPWVGNIRVGNIKFGIGLEHANSSRFLDFMERSLNQDAFTGVFDNGFAPGVLLYDWNEDQTVTWSSSLYKNAQNVFATDAGDRNNAVTGRVTWTPWYDEEAHGRYMMHFGCSSQYTGTTEDQLRIRARGSLRNGISQFWPITIDTGTFFCHDQVLLIPEWAMVYGRWHLQAEWAGAFLNRVNTTGVGNPTTNEFVDGYYFQVMYFLTGEHREYERKAGAFGRVVPYENFHLIRSFGRNSGSIFTRGAWQVGYRFNELDLRSGFINGGVQSDHTVGLNHFINPNMKMQYNFVVSTRNAYTAPNSAVVNPVSAPLGSNSYGFGIRVAHDF